MTYLYAGMGLAMLVAIMAMFEMANGLIGQQISTSPPEDSYLSSAYPTVDKRFLRLLQQLDHSLECSSIGVELSSNTEYSDLKPYQQGVPTPSPHSRFVAACVFTHGSHRVLIVPSSGSSIPSYQLFSCVLKDDFACTFERLKG